MTCEDGFSLAADFLIELAKSAQEDSRIVLITGSEQIYPAPGIQTHYIPINRSQLGSPQLDGIKIMLKSGVQVYVQSDLLRATWAAGSGQPYPRFEALQDGIGTVQEIFKAITGTIRSSVVANLSYVNLISLEESESVLTYFNSDYLPAALRSIEFFTSFEMAWPNGGTDFRIAINREQSTRNIVFNSIAGMFIQDPITFFEASDSLNQKLVHLFNGMLTDVARLKWEQE